MNVLAVGAHFDDLELGCSGTLIKHVDSGDQVTMLVITDSAYMNPEKKIIRDKASARREGEEAAAIIGAELICFDYETFSVPFDEKLSRDILCIIEQRNIKTIYSHWIHDLHRDHQFTGKATLMAGRHVPRFLMYRSNYYDTDQTFNSCFYSDITPHIEKKKKAICAFKSEMERRNYAWLDFFLKQNANDGQKIEVPYAEAFECIRYLI